MNRIQAYYQACLLKWNHFERKEKIFCIGVLIIAILALMQIFFWSAPSSFHANTIVEIKKGSTLNTAALDLETAGYIRSPFWFKVFVTIFGGSRSVIAGDYFFDSSIDVQKVAWRIIHGTFGLTPIKITIPEGLTNAQTAELFKKQFTFFDTKVFTEKAKQGKMFPDTYFFLQNAKAEAVIERMEQNFNDKVATLATDIASSSHPFDEVLVMASIIEDEANTEESRKIIADILWRRISIGMPLQVDSATTTYKQKGLPKEPITNPGIGAIIAALHPKKNAYLYFLSDLHGNMYYAKDFDGHQRNRELYFKK